MNHFLALFVEDEAGVGVGGGGMQDQWEMCPQQTFQRPWNVAFPLR